MNVLVLNTVALNGGDGAILLALVDGLRERLGSELRIVVHEAQPEVAARYYPSVTFRPTAWSSLGEFAASRFGEWRRRFLAHALLAAASGGPLGAVAERFLPSPARAALRDYRMADLVVTTGGTYLVEHYDLASRLLSFEVALAAGKPLVFYTQSLGPFRQPTVRATLKRILSRAELVLLRDVRSHHHAAALGGRTDHLRVVPDCVFSLATVERLAAATSTRRTAGRPLRVAVSVRDWSHFATRDTAEGMRAYLEAVRAATVYLVERHRAHVTFISTCQGIPEYAHDDSRTARAAVELLPLHVQAAVTVDESFHHPRELLDSLAAFDLVIATRMHFAILALAAGVPVIPIAYEFKMQELFAGLGQGDIVHDIESVSPTGLVLTVDALLTNEAATRRELFGAVADARSRAGAVNDTLATIVRSAADGLVVDRSANGPPVDSTVVSPHDQERA